MTKERIKMMRTRGASLAAILILTLAPLVSTAKEISRESALKVAGALVENKAAELLRSGKAELKQVDAVELQVNPLRSSLSQVAYYVYNVGDEQGWVIVSGSDLILPVIGYSLTGSYDASRLHPSFKYWMSQACKAIIYAEEKGEGAAEEVRKEWGRYLGSGDNYLRASTYVSPLIKTKWGQESPFNNLCPVANGVRTPSGCVATAAAQILKYHAYPANGKGVGQTEAYLTETRRLSVPSVNIGAQTYSWTSMINSYANGGGTSAQRSEVAKIMYHLGASVKMDYDVEGSGAAVSDAALSLVRHFGYDRSVAGKQRLYYSNADWRTVLVNELSAGRPVMYGGQSSQYGGHAWVVDGYDDSYYFHFNFGFDGQLDGYYTINDNSYMFPEANEMYTSLKPGAGGGQTHEFGIPTSAIFPGARAFSVSKSAVGAGEEFTIDGAFHCMSVLGFTGQVGYVLVNEASSIADIKEVVEILASTDNTTVPYNAGALAFTASGVSVSSAVPPGQYGIALAAISGNDVYYARPSNGKPGVLKLTVTGSAQPSTLTVSPSSLDYSPAQGSKTISVSSNTSWTVSKSAAWLTVSPNSGSNNSSVTVTASANASTSQRTAYITISGGGITRTVSVSQSGATATSLSISPSSLDFSSSASANDINVTSNTSWTATSSSSWITLAPSSGIGNGSFSISVQTNTGAARTGSVTVQGGGITRSVRITQGAGAASILNVSPASVAFPTSFSDTRILAITSNTGWEITDNADWITVDPASGCNNGSIAVTVDRNSSESKRTGSVTVKGGGLTRTISISQLSPAWMPFDAEGGTYEVSLTAPNISWAYTISAPWLTLSPSSGYGNAMVYATATQNSDPYPRVATISLSGGGETQTEIAEQDGSPQVSLNASPISMKYTVPSSSQSLTITSNAQWAISSNADWISISPTSGSGNGTVEVTIQVADNSSPDLPTGNRSAMLTVTCGWGVTQFVNVGQTGTPDEPAPISEVAVSSLDRLISVRSPLSERIEVYSISGALLYKDVKAAGTITFRLDIPEKIVIVKGSSGWVRKAVL